MIAQKTERKLTSPDRILLTASRLDREELSPFSLETLVICAWRDSPTDFGMVGYADRYPDTNKVIVNLSGLRGLVARGFLEKTGPKTYRITDAGRNRVKTLQNKPKEKPPEKPRILSPTQQEFLSRTLCSGAFHKWQQQIYEAIEFKDAVAFWDVSGVEGEQITEHLICFATTITQLEGLLMGAGELELASGMVVTRKDAQSIMTVHKLLLERYRRHLQLINKRKEQN